MIYAQFYTESTGYVPGTMPPSFDGPKRLIEACGDRAVIILDGRERTHAHHLIAEREAVKRGFMAYSLHKGVSFTNSDPITNVIKVQGL